MTIDMHRIVSVAQESLKFPDFYCLEITAEDTDGHRVTLNLYSREPLSVAPIAAESK